MEKQKPSVGRAILFSIIGLAAFYISYLVLGFLLALLFGLLMRIPVIKDILAFLLRIRRDSPDVLIVLVAVYASCSAVSWMLGRFCDNTETLALSHRIFGIALLVLNILFLVINIKEGNKFFPNIIVGIAGVLMSFSGKAS